jgi:hypothetical protein
VTYSILTRSWCIERVLRHIFLWLCLIPVQAFTQIAQTARYEVALPEGDAIFHTCSAEQSGLFLYRTITAPGNDALQLISLDTSLVERWSGFIPIERGYTERRTAYNDSALYVLMQHREFTKTDLQIASINSNTGRYVIHSFRNFIPLHITQFKVTGKAALIGGYFNRVPVVIYYSFAEGRSKIAPGLFNEAGELIQLRTYKDNSFDILVSAKNFMRQQTVIIRNYDSEGALIKNIWLEPEDRKNLIFGRSLKTSNEMQLVGGVYGNRNSEFSKGIFLSSIDPLGNDLTQYYTYADLENFFKYMRAKREQRVKNRIERRKIKGRKLRFTYRVVVHEIVHYKDQYIMLGEAFYPKYIYPDRVGNAGFFAPGYMMRNNYSQNGRIFDGFYYTHAVVIGFDQNGKLLWDNSFEINDVKTFELEQFVKLDVQPDHITLLYLFDQKIRTKIINDNEVVEGKSIEPIAQKFDTDVIKKGGTTNSRLDYWYGHQFMASGVQTISYSVDGVGLKRTVFFVNKVSHP